MLLGLANCVTFLLQERQREQFQYVLKENNDLKKMLQSKRDQHADRMLKMHQVHNSFSSSFIVKVGLLWRFSSLL
jgi:hypothetical protein